MDLDRNNEVGQMGRSLNETLGVLRGAFDEVTHRASQDGLTGLANRTLLHERLVSGMDAPEDVYAVADRLLHDIQSPTDFNGSSLTPRASIGWRCGTAPRRSTR